MQVLSQLWKLNLGISSETLPAICVLAVVKLKTTSCVAKILLLSRRVFSKEFLKSMVNSKIGLT